MSQPIQIEALGSTWKVSVRFTTQKSKVLHNKWLIISMYRVEIAFMNWFGVGLLNTRFGFDLVAGAPF